MKLIKNNDNVSEISSIINQEKKFKGLVNYLLLYYSYSSEKVINDISFYSIKLGITKISRNKLSQNLKINSEWLLRE